MSHQLPDHGTTTSHRYGCRCDACRAARAEYDQCYYAKHREKRLKQMSEYRAAHSKELLERVRDYRLTHRDEIAERNRAYDAVHREERRQYQRQYRSTHPETYREWLRAHPEKVATKNRNRRAREAGNGGVHTDADVIAQYERQKGKCFYCGKKLDDDYHVDHVVPLALGGSNGPENLVIACAYCNVSKGAKHPIEFAGILC